MNKDPKISKHGEDFWLDIFDDADEHQQDLKNASLADSLQEDLGKSSRYDIKELIGEGALKKVYLAYDKALDRNVAYALMKEGGHEDDFLNEARLASTLSHPYIAPVYDLGFDENGRAFFVMKLYEGVDLEEYLMKSKSLSTSEIISIFLKVCEAISFAHSCGVLHLDIKPSNVRIDEFGGILLCDWGISKVIGQKQGDRDLALVDKLAAMSAATLHGEFRGTPGFMAPEQRDKTRGLSKATDVYGLGAFLYFMMEAQVVEEAYVFKQDYPKALQAICEKCLADNTEERYETVDGLIRDIENFNSGLVTLAENLGALGYFVFAVKKHSRKLMFYSANLILITLFLIYFLRRDEENKQVISQQSQEIEQRQKELAEQKVEEAQELFLRARNALFAADDGVKFNFSTVSLAESLITRALALDESPKYWGFQGRIFLIQNKLDKAKASFVKAGKNYQNYLKVLDGYFSDLESQKLKGHDRNLHLIKCFRKAKLDHLIVNFYIQKELSSMNSNIHMTHFAAKSLAIINDHEKADYSFDEKALKLDLSRMPVGNPFPLKALHLKHLSLRNSPIKVGHLHSLQLLPLITLDLSYTEIPAIKYLAMNSIEELNIEACPIENLTGLRWMRSLNRLNIAFVKADFQVLRRLNLEQITISEDQFEEVKKYLNKDCKIIVKKAQAKS